MDSAHICRSVPRGRPLSGQTLRMTTVRLGWVLRSTLLVFLVAALAYVVASLLFELVN